MSAPSGGGEGGGKESAAGGVSSSSLAPSSLPPPRPKSPPEYPDLYGKRREAARVQMLEREIGFLEASLSLSILLFYYYYYYYFKNSPFHSYFIHKICAIFDYSEEVSQYFEFHHSFVFIIITLSFSKKIGTSISF